MPMISSVKTYQLPSKIIQISTVFYPGDPNCGPHLQVFALCEDGTLWQGFDSTGRSNVPTDGMWRLFGGEEFYKCPDDQN